MNRIEQEKQVVSTMIKLYCKKHHQRHSVCPECQALQDYALLRLSRCRHGENKNFCAHCPTQCYQKHHKEKMKEVMRFSGPRMLLHHPILAIKHVLHR